MLTVLRYTLARSRGAILGWGIAILLLGAMFVPFIDLVVEEGEQFQQLLEIYPEEMMAFFGDMNQLATPEGFLSLEYFALMPVILGIYAVMAGSGMLVGDEEAGTLDLIASYPISRAKLFFGRFIALMISLLLILVIAWLGIVIPSLFSEHAVDSVDLLIPFTSLYAVLLLLGSLALALSLLLPARRMASMLAGVFVVADFFIQGLAELRDELKPVAKVLPLNFYQGEGWTTESLNLEWFFGLLGVALALVLLAWWRFERRDIRVGGEGGWTLPVFGRKRRQAVEAGSD